MVYSQEIEYLGRSLKRKMSNWNENTKKKKLAVTNKKNLIMEDWLQAKSTPSDIFEIWKKDKRNEVWTWVTPNK